MDQRFAGPLSDQIARAESLMRALLPEITRLDPVTGRFVTITEIPRFAWLEAIVNAVTHRSYSLQGDCIRITVYDDRIEIQNPGRLPGPVRIDNIRHTRFSRNPRIARSLTDLGIARELNEGVPRMFREMADADLPEPSLGQTEAGFKITLNRLSETDRVRVRELINSVPDWMIGSIHTLIADRRVTTSQVARLSKVVNPTARRHLQRLEELGLVRRIGSSAKDPHAYWELVFSVRGVWQRSDLEDLKNDLKTEGGN
jgi:ATP-dependent DNA helicase RecG